jgi:hypothetical protein
MITSTKLKNNSKTGSIGLAFFDLAELDNLQNTKKY